MKHARKAENHFQISEKFISLHLMKRIFPLDDLHKGSNADNHDIY